MHIKKGDTVYIRAGKDRGKTGKVLSFGRGRSRIAVEGINVYKKHSRPKRQGEKGESILVPRPLSASNVMLYCASCDTGVRAGVRSEGDKKTRFCKRCKATM